MHSAANLDITTQQQTARSFFLDLWLSEKLSAQSNEILQYGRELLDECNQLTRSECDKIITGTLLLAFARNDLKYSSASSVPKHLNTQIYQQIMEFRKTSLTFHPNAIYQKEDILLVGQKVLEDKTINFNGTFSQLNSMQSMISQGLPFINSDYFEIYGIKSAADTPRMGD